MMEGVSDTVLLAIAGLLFFAVVCFLFALWGMNHEAKRYHSYEPLDPDDED